MEELAIFGGQPISRVKLTRPSPIQQEEIEISLKVINEGILSQAGRGHFVKLFEHKFATYHGSKYAISCTSGTSALHIAVKSLNLSKRDEVIVPSLTFISTASAVLHCNAKPVFVDIDLKTFCLNPKDLEKKVNRNTKAIIVVHLYGHPADMDSIMSTAKKHKLIVIEDCAQAHGALYKNKLVGTFGDIACFSFYQTKNMTCGEGGMILTNHESLYKTCSSLIDHGIVDGNLESYNYNQAGFNYHLTEIQAAIGSVQLEKLRQNNRIRQNNAYLYKNFLKDTGITFQSDHVDINHVYYSLTALLPCSLQENRDWFVRAVKRENVDINKLYPLPLHNTDLFKKRNNRSHCPNSEKICMRLFNFFTNPGITSKYIELTCKAITKVLDCIENNPKICND